MTMRKIINCFNHELLKIQTKVVEIARLDKCIKKYLSADLSVHCQATNLEQGCLILTLDNQIWATQLRYETPELLTSLRTHEKMYSLRSIKHQVVPPQTTGQSYIRKNFNMTPKAYKIIHDAALKCEDQGLQQALLKLSATVKEMAENRD